MAWKDMQFPRTQEWSNTQDKTTVLHDPVWEDFKAAGRAPDLDLIRTLFPGTVGKQPFDMNVIDFNIKRMQTEPEVDTGHPFLDLSVKAGLAYIDAVFQGNHPKYGSSNYAKDADDGFPPVIIAVVDALTAWGMHDRARDLFAYWIRNLLRDDDGATVYTGTSVSERGMLLDTAALLEERSGGKGWWEQCRRRIAGLAGFLLRLHEEAVKRGGILFGVPEDDEAKNPGCYFHNSAWAARGLTRWADLCERTGYAPHVPVSAVREAAETIRQNTLNAIKKTWPADPADWWLPPQTEPVERPKYVTHTVISSYSNYRYWPELLSSGILPADMANRIVETRLTAGGQFCGMTRFMNRLDDWPLADYLYGLWALGRKQEFMMSLYGHVAYHQAAGHLAAYEQVTFPLHKYRGAREQNGHCIPSQLVAARAARLIQK